MCFCVSPSPKEVKDCLFFPEEGYSQTQLPARVKKGIIPFISSLQATIPNLAKSLWQMFQAM